MITTELNMVGFYVETCPQLARKLPSILTAERKNYAFAERLKILKYLDRGNLHSSVFGETASDPFTSPPRSLDGQIKMLTDGKWIWPSSLRYFVFEYGLLIPDEFIEDMKSNNWTPPHPPDRKKPSGVSIDSDASKSPNINRISKTFDFGLLFSNCHSIEDVFYAGVAKTSELVSQLNVNRLNDKERLDLASDLSRSTSPPKFVSESNVIADKQVLADAKPTQFVEMLADQSKLPLSWDEKQVVWLKLVGDQWQVELETWADAFA